MDGSLIELLVFLLFIGFAIVSKIISAVAGSNKEEEKTPQEESSVEPWLDSGPGPKSEPSPSSQQSSAPESHPDESYQPFPHSDPFSEKSRPSSTPENSSGWRDYQASEDAGSRGTLAQGEPAGAALSRGGSAEAYEDVSELPDADQMLAQAVKSAYPTSGKRKVEQETKKAAVRLNPRDKKGLRQALVMNEVLNRPRAFDV